MLSCIMGDTTYPANQVQFSMQNKCRGGFWEPLPAESACCNNLQQFVTNTIPELESGVVRNCHVTADMI